MALPEFHFEPPLEQATEILQVTQVSDELSFLNCACKMAAARLQRSSSHLVLKFALVVVAISSFRCVNRDLKLIQLHNATITNRYSR